MEVFQKTISKYLTDSNQSVEFKIVKDVKGLEKDHDSFHPVMSHQIFGENEQIFGYLKPRVLIQYTSCSLDVYLKFSYESKIDPAKHEGVKADEVLKKVIANTITSWYTFNVDKFSVKLQEQTKFRPYGTKIYSYIRTCKFTDHVKTFEVYKADTSLNGFLDYHKRLQSFLLWFVDAASFIDVDDEKWDFFVIYDKEKTCEGTKYHFVGYSTCYRFYAYPDKVRPRISQVFVLPTYQRQGHCSELIKSIYQEYVSRSDVLDMTAEDPSEEFQRVRDYVDCANCVDLAEFKPPLIFSNSRKDKCRVALEKFKINKRQARRICEIMQLFHTNEANEKQLTNYYTKIRKRISDPIKSLNSRKNRLMQASMKPQDEEEVEEMIDRETKDTIEQYRKVVARLKIKYD